MRRVDIRNFDTSAAIEANRIVALTGNTLVAHATASTTGVIGISDTGADDGQRVDVVMSGSMDVTYGGTVAAGAWLVADAEGRAVSGAKSGNTVGIALVSGVLGDLGEVLIK